MGVLFRNPVQMVIDAAVAAFPGLTCEVDFCAEIDVDTDALGVTIWPGDGGIPQVFARLDLRLEQLIEILAHEFAHVAAGAKAGHGPEWEAAFEAIGVQWERLQKQPHPSDALSLPGYCGEGAE